MKNVSCLWCSGVLVPFCVADVCMCVCSFTSETTHVIGCWLLCVYFFCCTLSPPHAYTKAQMCECDSVPVPCRTPASCLFLKTKKRRAAEETLLPLHWWKATLIEWPGTQPPSLIITAVQLLLITLKACRAPRSPVMLWAIRERVRKIRSPWQNKLSEKPQKRVEEEDQRRSGLTALLDSFLSLSSSWWSRDAVCY